LCKLPKFSDPNLLVGFDTSDDASVYQLNETTAIIQTVDMFPPVTDDPYDFGRIAAANALSDVYAMGGEPRLALNILCYPEDFPMESIEGILRGGYDKVAEAGAIITGGHTINDPIPKYGLSVTGFAHPKDIRTNNGVREGDVLILTKPIGIGTLNSAATIGVITEEEKKSVIQTMAELNKTAFEVSRGFPIHASTDVTGFGLLGHAYEMFAGTECSLSLLSWQVPVLEGALAYARQAIVPGGTFANQIYLDEYISYSSAVDHAVKLLLADPQTSGGLLLALNEKDAQILVKRLQDHVARAEIVGFAAAKKEHRIYVE
jgi:selenide, water dikinase